MRQAHFDLYDAGQGEPTATESSVPAVRAAYASKMTEVQSRRLLLLGKGSATPQVLMDPCPNQGYLV